MRKRTSKNKMTTFLESLGTFSQRVTITIIFLIAFVFTWKTKLGIRLNAVDYPFATLFAEHVYYCLPTGIV